MSNNDWLNNREFLLQMARSAFGTVGFELDAEDDPNRAAAIVEAARRLSDAIDRVEAQEPSIPLTLINTADDLSACVLATIKWPGSDRYTLEDLRDGPESLGKIATGSRGDLVAYARRHCGRICRPDEEAQR